jgi:hypothetical protein
MEKRAAAMFMVFMMVMMGVSPAGADDFSGAIRAAVAREIAQPTQAARLDNPHKLPAFALMGGGAALIVLAFLNPSGVECSSDINVTKVECGTSSNKGLLLGGAAALGAGGFMYWRGERQRALPQVTVHGGRVMVSERVSW